MTGGVVVIDASVALKWLIPQARSEEALALLDDWSRQGVALLVPDLFISEVTNALYKHVRVSKELSVGEATRVLEDVIGMVNVSHADAQLADRALVLTADLGRPATYDSFYAALAEREGCMFWTDDQKYYNAVHRHLAWVQWIGGQPRL